MKSLVPVSLKLINIILHQLMKQGNIIDKFYQELRTPGLNATRLCGSANEHKNGTLIRPVLSIIGRPSINFCLPFWRGCQVQILGLTRKMPEPH